MSVAFRAWICSRGEAAELTNDTILQVYLFQRTLTCDLAPFLDEHGVINSSLVMFYDCGKPYLNTGPRSPSVGRVALNVCVVDNELLFGDFSPIKRERNGE